MRFDHLEKHGKHENKLLCALATEGHATISTAKCVSLLVPGGGLPLICSSFTL
eukprot:COSAG01_NODE_68759_length_263_cov_0.634146_2_plen_52_part_01